MEVKKYYIVAIVMILAVLVLFFLSFEEKKPKAREVVTLGVLIALAVASRVAFIYMPHFKPTAAIVMLAGIAFGMQAGFLVGACSMLLSNFIFGQGYWTPWQMFAFGVAGFLAGFLFNTKFIKANRWTMTIFGAIEIILITGPILDTSSVFVMLDEYTPAKIMAIYASGFPVNVVHATAVALTLFLIGVPMLEKLERIKKKYGIMEK